MSAQHLHVGWWERGLLVKFSQVVHAPSNIDPTSSSSWCCFLPPPPNLNFWMEAFENRWSMQLFRWSRVMHCSSCTAFRAGIEPWNFGKTNHIIDAINSLRILKRTYIWSFSIPNIWLCFSTWPYALKMKLNKNTPFKVTLFSHVDRHWGDDITIPAYVLIWLFMLIYLVFPFVWRRPPALQTPTSFMCKYPGYLGNESPELTHRWSY